MKNSAREAIHARAHVLDNVEVIDFENNMSQLMTGAIGVVAMGGYNTFCDILSYDKRAIIVPRTHPRQEQLIRATRAQDLGLVTMLHPEQASDPHVMADALRHLPMQSLPSEADQPGLMDGLINVAEETGDIFFARRGPTLSVIEGGS
jgi:predicted glycosyltransferase